MNILSHLFTVNLNYAKLKRQQSTAMKLQLNKCYRNKKKFNNSGFLYLPATRLSLPSRSTMQGGFFVSRKGQQKHL